MKTVFEQMLLKYDISTSTNRRNATFEVMQQIILAGLQRGGFFEMAAFYGGTCLRIFHGLERFSEDMDFTLLKENNEFNLEKFFPFIINEFKTIGREVTITRKDKNHDSKVESAFLKDDTEIYNVNFQTERSLRIKIEVDKNPPPAFETENKISLQPFSFMTRVVTLPNLFAGKLHALLFRSWKNRVKGRDWYDFEWYVRNQVPLNFEHLKQRACQFNGIDLTSDSFHRLLREKLSTTDIKLVKQDVRPFLKNSEGLEIWSNDYFLELAKMIQIQ